MISTKGRYAMRLMVDLAEHSNGNNVSLKSISSRQDISLKYLEKILPPLVQNNLITGSPGPKGGYRLTRDPADYTILEILNTTEGTLAPVACLDCPEKPCQRKETCPTVGMWEGLHTVIRDYFENITLKDLMHKDKQK